MFASADSIGSISSNQGIINDFPRIRRDELSMEVIGIRGIIPVAARSPHRAPRSEVVSADYVFHLLVLLMQSDRSMGSARFNDRSYVGHDLIRIFVRFRLDDKGIHK